MRAVRVDDDGRITVPKFARRRLGIDAPGLLVAELEGDTLVLRPAVIVRREQRPAPAEQDLRAATSSRD